MCGSNVGVSMSARMRMGSIAACLRLAMSLANIIFVGRETVRVGCRRRAPRKRTPGGSNSVNGCAGGSSMKEGETGLAGDRCGLV